MNKIFYLSLLLGTSLLFTGCKNEEDDLFSQRAAERLNQISSQYSASLEASANGWAMQLYPTTKNTTPEGAGYLLLLKFNADHSVRVAMNNRFSQNKYAEDTSVWEVIADDGPVLSFNTYNKCLHQFSDPADISGIGGDASTSDDKTGTGVGGDYEFIITDAPSDASYMMLKGKKRSTYNLLTPLQDNVDFKQYLADIDSFMNVMFASNSPTSNYLYFGDSVYVFKDASTGVPTLYPEGGDEVSQSSFNPFVVTKRGNDFYLRFRDAFTKNGVTTQDYRYDKEHDRFISVDNAAYYLKGDIPSRFFTEVLGSDSKYWSWTAKDDASQKYANQMANLNKAIQNRKYSLQKIALRYLGKQVLMRVTYVSKTTSNVDYKFTVTPGEGDNVALKYEGPVNQSGQNFLNALPELKELIDALNKSFTVKSNVTDFNLNTLKLMDSENADDWFVVTLN